MGDIFPSFNIIAVFVSAAAYWLLGALWYSVLTGNAWENELRKQGITIKDPTKKELIRKLALSFL